MFDEILKMVKDHLGNNQEISSLPADQQDAVHHEVATQMTNELKNMGFATGYPYIEIYGHWTNDETRLETELLMSLK